MIDKKRYFGEYKGSRCPFCGSIVFDSIAGDYGDLFYKALWECCKCTRAWRDTYKLIDVEEIKEE